MAAFHMSVSSSEPSFTVESLTWRDRVEIQDIVREWTYLPIASIKRTGEWRIEVLTLSGCVVYRFEFKKDRGQWQRVNSSVIVSVD
jgi:hypothetical protein